MDFFGVLRGQNSAAFPMELHFPNFEGKNSQSSKNFFFFFFVEDWNFHSVNTHTSYMVMFSFNLMAIIYVIANFFY